MSKESSVVLSPLHKKIIAATLTGLIVLGAGGTAYLSSKNEKQPATAQADVQAPQTKNVPISVEAKDWNENSTPIIVHLKGVDGSAKGTDFYHGTTYEEVAAGKAEVSVVDGSYEISAVSAINSDGSLYDVSQVALKVEVARTNKADDTKTDATLDLGVLPKIDADKVTDEQMQQVVADITTAITNGDDSLKGDSGDKVLSTAQTNAAANKNISDETKATLAQEVKTTKDSGATTSEPSIAAPKASGTTNQTKGHWEDKPVYSKVWVQDKAAWDETVVVSEAWDEPVYTTQYIYWTSDGQTFSSQAEANAHVKEVAFAGGDISTGVKEKQVQTGTTHHPAQTKTVHHPASGHYENKQTGTTRVWVSD